MRKRPVPIFPGTRKMESLGLRAMGWRRTGKWKKNADQCFLRTDACMLASYIITRQSNANLPSSSLFFRLKACTEHVTCIAGFPRRPWGKSYHLPYVAAFALLLLPPISDYSDPRCFFPAHSVRPRWLFSGVSVFREMYVTSLTFVCRDSRRVREK